MAWFSRRRAAPLISVVVPVYDVAEYLPACLDSLLAQTHRNLDIVVVDDDSPDHSGAIADAYAARDDRIRVLHIDNRGLGGARNEGLRHTRGEWFTFADSDDVVPPTAYAALLEHARATKADLVTGDMVRWSSDGLTPMPWSARLHRDRTVLAIEDRPELLGDVFAVNKLYRRDFWDGLDLSWPERLRYEDQPTLTRAYVAAQRIGVVPDVVYHWRQREDGSSITQQRNTVADLTDRWTTKQMALDTVTEHGSAEVTRVFRHTVLPGDMGRYFRCIPDGSDEWWDLLVGGVRELWSGEWSLAHSTLPPVHRLTGWLVEQDRRADAETVVRFRAEYDGPLPRVPARDGGVRIDVPGVDMESVEPTAVAIPQAHDDPPEPRGQA